MNKMKYSKLFPAVKNILLVVSSLFFFDAFVTILGASYLSEKIGAFLGKSATVILSDLLFLEGVTIFTIGTFIMAVETMRKTEPPSKAPSNTSTRKTVNGPQPRDKHVSYSTAMILIGIILIALSIIVGTFLR